MGLFSGGSTKSKSWSGSAQTWAKPKAIDASNDTMNVYEQNAQPLQSLTGEVRSLVPGLRDMFTVGNPVVSGGRDYLSEILSGAELQEGGNPWLEGMIGQTANDVQSRIGAQFGARGSFGGTAHALAAGRGLGEAENALRYQNYSDAMNRISGAAGMVPSIAQAEYTGLPEILQTAGVAAEIPYTGTNAQAGALAQLFQGEYSKSKTKGPGIGSVIAGGLASGIGSALGKSDIRLKEGIEYLGQTEDGLGWYEFAYKGETGRYRGVMAQEVAAKRPEALGPLLDGFMTVRYDRLSRPMERV